MGVPLDRLTVVPVGVDADVFKPYADVVKKKGRLMVTTSSDVPMKGLVPLLEAIAKLRAEREVDLIVIGQPQKGGRVAKALERLGLTDIVTTISASATKSSRASTARRRSPSCPASTKGSPSRRSRP